MDWSLLFLYNRAKILPCFHSEHSLVLHCMALVLAIGEVEIRMRLNGFSETGPGEDNRLCHRDKVESLLLDKQNRRTVSRRSREGKRRVFTVAVFVEAVPPLASRLVGGRGEE